MPRDISGNMTLASAPFTFGQKPIPSSPFNVNFSDLVAELTDSLSRSGKGGMLANLAMGGNSITGAASGTFSGTVTAAVGSFSGAVTAASFSGSGASLTAINAANITSGTLPVARLNGGTSAQFVRGDGSYSNTLAGPFVTQGTITVSSNAVFCGVAGTGTGGSFRATDDGGTTRWLMGILGSNGARDFNIYDLASSVSSIVIESSTGRVTTTARSEQYGIGTRFSSAGGVVYFGAASASATPDARISNAGGGTIAQFNNDTGFNLGAGKLVAVAAGNITIPAPSSGNTVTAQTLSGSAAFVADSTASATSSAYQLSRNGTLNALIGSVGTAGNLIVGSSVGDLAIRNNGPVRISVDNGATTAWQIDGSGRLLNSGNTQPRLASGASGTRTTTGFFTGYGASAYDIGAAFNASAGVWTCPVTGYYDFDYVAGGTTSAANTYVIFYVLISGTAEIGHCPVSLPTSGTSMFAAGSGKYYLTAGATVTVNISILNGSVSTSLITRFSAALRH